MDCECAKNVRFSLSLSVRICKEEEDKMAAILLCISSPRILCVLRAQPEKKIMEMGSSGPQHLLITDLLRQVSTGQNLPSIVSRLWHC